MTDYDGLISGEYFSLNSCPQHSFPLRSPLDSGGRMRMTDLRVLI